MYIVYLVANIADVSGGTRVIVEHANRLKDLGHKVEIWTIGEDHMPYFDCKVPVINVDWVKVSEPDILVMTEPNLMANVFSLRQKTTGTFLLLQHDNEWIIEGSKHEGAAQLAGFTKENLEYIKSGKCQVLVVSTWLQQIVHDKYGLDSHLILNCIDGKIFHKDAEPLLNSDSPAALTFYDPQYWKGFEDAYLALAEVKNSIPDLKIIIISRFMPPFPKIGENGYSSFSHPVIYFNRPDQQDIARIYTSASVFVSASWLEGFGLPGLEALACGTPVVTTDSGGVKDYAVNEETAIVTQPRNVPELTEGVLKVLNDEALRKDLVRNGLKKVAEFDWDISIKELINVFTAHLNTKT